MQGYTLVKRITSALSPTARLAVPGRTTCNSSEYLLLVTGGTSNHRKLTADIHSLQLSYSSIPWLAETIDRCKPHSNHSIIQRRRLTHSREARVTADPATSIATHQLPLTATTHSITANRSPGSRAGLFAHASRPRFSTTSRPGPPARVNVALHRQRIKPLCIAS